MFWDQRSQMYLVPLHDASQFLFGSTSSESLQVKSNGDFVRDNWWSILSDACAVSSGTNDLSPHLEFYEVFVFWSAIISSYDLTAATPVKACLQSLGSAADWCMWNLCVTTLLFSSRGVPYIAHCTLMGSQLQPLITPTARPSPLWSLTIGEITGQGRGSDVLHVWWTG